MSYAPTTDADKPPVSRIEMFFAVIMLIFPMIGAFEPFENYFNPALMQNSQSVMYAPHPSFFISTIEHIASLAILAVLCAMNWRRLLREMTLAVPIMMLIGWMTLSALWSVDSSNTMHRALHMIDHVLFAFYLMARFTWRELIALLVRSFGVIVGLSFLMVAVFPELGFSTLNGYRDAWRGAFSEKNALGAAMSIGTLIAAYSYAIQANRRWVALLVGLGAFLLLVMSRSATSTVALLTDAGLFIVITALVRHNYSVWRAGALLMMGTGIVAAAVIAINTDSINQVVHRSSDMTGRTEIWHYVTKEIARNPVFGYGYGFWDAVSKPRLQIWQALGWPTPHAHDEWLDMTLQTGVIGLFLEILCWLTASLRSLRYTITTSDSRAIFGGLVVVNMLLRSISETIMADPAISSWIWGVIAYLALSHVARETAARNLTRRMFLPRPASAPLS